MSEPTQFELLFPPEGEGDNRHLMTDDRVTRSLKNKASEVYRLIVHSKLDYDRLKDDYDEIKKSIKGQSHAKWVTFKGFNCSYQTLAAQKKFIDDYPSMQCSRIELLRALLKSLADRNVIVNVDESVLDSAGC